VAPIGRQLFWSPSVSHLRAHSPVFYRLPAAGRWPAKEIIDRPARPVEGLSRLGMREPPAVQTTHIVTPSLTRFTSATIIHCARIAPHQTVPWHRRPARQCSVYSHGPPAGTPSLRPSPTCQQPPDNPATDSHGPPTIPASAFITPLPLPSRASAAPPRRPRSHTLPSACVSSSEHHSCAPPATSATSPSLSH
jgi:hypothetical protein